MGELLKGRFNRGLKENIYFWRDNAGHEVDCLIDRDMTLIPLEIKSGDTVTRDFFKGLNYWYKTSQSPTGEGYLIYGGDVDQKRMEGHVLGWRSFVKELPLEI